MKVVTISEDSHGEIGIANNYKNAIKFLIKEGWLENCFPIYNYDMDEWSTPEELYGSDWQATFENWEIDMFNDVFEGSFILSEQEVFEAED